MKFIQEGWHPMRKRVSWSVDNINELIELEVIKREDIPKDFEFIDYYENKLNEEQDLIGLDEFSRLTPKEKVVKAVEEIGKEFLQIRLNEVRSRILTYVSLGQEEE